MASLNELMQGYVNMSYDELLGMCRRNIANLCDILKGKLDGDQDKTATIVLLVFGACLGADDAISELEVKFVNDLLGASKSASEIRDLVATFGNGNAVDTLDKIADALPAEEKAVLLSACLCFLAVDETINVKEIEFLKKLIVE